MQKNWLYNEYSLFMAHGASRNNEIQVFDISYQEHNKIFIKLYNVRMSRMH